MCFGGPTAPSPANNPALYSTDNSQSAVQSSSTAATTDDMAPLTKPTPSAVPQVPLRNANTGLTFGGS